MAATESRLQDIPGDRVKARSMVPTTHRIRLSDGRVLTADLHRPPRSRLVDHLVTLGGFLSLTHVEDAESGERTPYLAVNVDYVVSIEELEGANENAAPIPWLEE